jgi:hypothetical protein
MFAAQLAEEESRMRTTLPGLLHNGLDQLLYGTGGGGGVGPGAAAHQLPASRAAGGTAQSGGGRAGPASNVTRSSGSGTNGIGGDGNGAGGGDVSWSSFFSSVGEDVKRKANELAVKIQVVSLPTTAVTFQVDDGACRSLGVRQLRRISG